MIGRISDGLWKGVAHSGFVYFIDVRVLKAKEERVKNGLRRITNNVKKTPASVLSPENIIGVAQVVANCSA